MNKKFCILLSLYLCFSGVSLFGMDAKVQLSDSDSEVCADLMNRVLGAIETNGSSVCEAFNNNAASLDFINQPQNFFEKIGSGKILTFFNNVNHLKMLTNIVLHQPKEDPENIRQKLIENIGFVDPTTGKTTGVYSDDLHKKLEDELKQNFRDEDTYRFPFKKNKYKLILLALSALSLGVSVLAPQNFFDLSDSPLCVPFPRIVCAILSAGLGIKAGYHICLDFQNVHKLRLQLNADLKSWVTRLSESQQEYLGFLKFTERMKEEEIFFHESIYTYDQRPYQPARSALNKFLNVMSLTTQKLHRTKDGTGKFNVISLSKNKDEVVI